jgi:hypothetical protein
MEIQILIGVFIVYFIGFFIGRKYEKHKTTEGVIGVMAQINENNEKVESVTYFYSEDAYQEQVEELKNKGAKYYEQ